MFKGRNITSGQGNEKLSKFIMTRYLDSALGFLRKFCFKIFGKNGVALPFPEGTATIVKASA